jgi:ubiquinone biosynthesis protein UbiJ
MATQSPFSLLESFLQDFKLPFTPPDWAVEETQRRIVLLLNHVLMQEPQATSRLARQKGRAVLVQWQSLSFKVSMTPAGLLDLAPANAAADLVLTLTDPSPLALVQGLAQGGKPAVRIEGDVQLAAEVNWLTDHVRWDLEADLARIVGDVPAHLLVSNGRKILLALQQFVAKGRPSAANVSGMPPAVKPQTESAP